VWFHIGTIGCLRMYSSRQSSKVGSFILSQLCMFVTCGKLCLTHLVTLCTECTVCTTCCNIKVLRLLPHSISILVMVMHSTLCEVGISFIYNWDKCQINQVISSFLLNRNFSVAVQSIYLSLEQWFPTWGRRTPRGADQDIKGYTKKLNNETEISELPFNWNTFP
jgi:hypothetical protein